MLFISPPFGNYLTFFPDTIPIKGSFTIDNRPGKWSQIFKTLRYSYEYEGWVNKIGLRNPGIDYAIDNYREGEIVSIAILKNEDVEALNNKIPEDMNIEINVSCPNTNDKPICKGLSCFINPKREWCIIKVSPISDKRQIKEYYNEGFKQFHCCNTLPIREGGLSGKSIIPHTISYIKYIKDELPTDTVVIAGGGVESVADINDYLNAGADHISISSVCFNPTNFLGLYLKYLNLK